MNDEHETTETPGYDRPAVEAWMQANIDRLHRSLKKTAAASKGLNWNDEDWEHLLEGYAGPAAN